MIIKNILILGYGNIGHLLAEMLNQLEFQIFIIDNHIPKKIKFSHSELDLAKDIKELTEYIESNKIDTIISCLPYHLNKKIALFCSNNKLHYFDLTEDIDTSKYIKRISRNSNNIFMPQNGLAPGFIGILGNHLISECDDGIAEHLKLRVGALPENPIGSLGYACNWSIDGLINEYIKPTEIIENSKRCKVPSLEREEMIKINGNNYEAFLTSGGLGTLIYSLQKKVKNLNYKTIRYLGHLDKIKFLFNELQLKFQRPHLIKILQEALPPDNNDRVLIHASVLGKFNQRLRTKEIIADYHSRKLYNKQYTAIAWTTAGSMAAIIELLSKNTIKHRGFVEINEINLHDLLNTQMGKLFMTKELNYESVLH